MAIDVGTLIVGKSRENSVREITLRYSYNTLPRANFKMLDTSTPTLFQITLLTSSYSGVHVL
ncbi:hypothetical protein N7471_010345 [Penicillium samsonianum]|uniref:uncharacterized protein n=1 Tax=Penicillium samsonianum TaxID=1882272 RepID=UPI002547F4FE|nr:uncharacterized protein N7471_010345 [Penicillium samsonianum]KAJ6125852.1 hypothetical protein N7471_010345 [Penicillium samsonianum]